MNPQQLAVVVVAATLGVLLLLLLAYGRPRRAAQEPLPANFSRGDPDSVLEGARLQKIQIWGVWSSIFITGFLAAYFVWEPFRQQSFQKSHYVASLTQSIERGKHEFLPGEGTAACANCHGPNGEGGRAATDQGWPAPPLNNAFQRFTRAEITRIIQAGRPGTPMPTWGVSFGGPLNDQVVEDIVNYLQSIQVPAENKYELPQDLADGSEVFTQKCSICHGADATGQAMGKPLPTFYAPDLTTEFYRLGLKVLKESRKNFDPKTAKLEDVLKAGEEAVINTIRNGRLNTPMPAWKDRIAPSQVDAVIAYLRSIQRQPR